MTKCDQCPVYVCCSQLCSERENEIFKRYALNGKIEIELTFLTSKTMNDILRELKRFTPKGSINTFIRKSKNMLYVEDMSHAGRLKRIKKEEKTDVGNF